MILDHVPSDVGKLKGTAQIARTVKRLLVRMGPPRYEEVRFEFSGAPMRQTVRIRYLL